MGRSRVGILAGAWLLALAVSGMSRTVPVVAHDPGVPIALDPLLTGAGKITSIAHAGDGTGRLFLVEKPGYVWIVRDGERLPEPFLDVQKPVRARGNEQGLLGLAFHPDFARKGAFFVHYTDKEGSVTIARYHVSRSNPDRADPKSGEILLTIPKQAEDHNGGMLQFGPDGYLYIAVGDGGAETESERNAQRTDVLLGKILRIDVDRADDGKPYGIPPDNPLVGVDGARPEIWAYGLRNPWRFSFDRQTGDLYIADVGLWQSEEINVQPAGVPGGRNYGWNVMEGELCREETQELQCGSPELMPPVYVYHHEVGCAIVGGYVYRGAAIPELYGRYVFGDFCMGEIWTLSAETGSWVASAPYETEMNVSTFGEDESGELLVADLKGTVYRIVAE